MKRSAGILAYRKRKNIIEFFLVHPGGPFWKNKDEHAWSIPKGEYQEDEDPEQAARREFQEETSIMVTGKLKQLTPVKQPSGKLINAWLTKQDVDESTVTSNTFSMDLPPKSGRVQEFPEVDKGAWFNSEQARVKIHKGQWSLVEEALGLIAL